jgi:hypothetical protein
LQQLVDGCVRHRTAPLAETGNRIVEELRPDRAAVEDDLLLLSVEAYP